MRNKTPLLPLSKGTLAVCASLILLLVVVGIRHAPRAANAKPDVIACRVVLASLNGNDSIDTEISRQQALIRNGSTSGLERLGWTFVKKARLTFDASFYHLAEQCAACMEASGPSGRQVATVTRPR